MQEGMWCHVEIPVQDVERAQKFYSECFGWKFQSAEGMPYHLYSTGEGGIGGGMMKPPPEYPHQMVNYVLVNDVEGATARVANNGGEVVVPKQEVPHMGWFTFVKDPEGNLFGLWQAMTQG